VTEASAAILAIELTDFVPHHIHHCLNDQLGDSVAALDAICGSLIGVQQNGFDLTAVRAVDEPWAVDHGDSMFERESAARQDEPRISEWECERDTRRDESSAAGCRDDGIFTSEQVEAGVSRMRVRRKRELGIETDDTDLEIIRGHASTLLRHLT
jgi:hypothetical protein